MLLQYMAAKLGIVSQMDLAQAIRARTSKKLGIVLWILTELAIMATDIAEVIGAAIALYLLFHIPLVIAVLVTVLDVLVLLLLTKIGFRKSKLLLLLLFLSFYWSSFIKLLCRILIWGLCLKASFQLAKHLQVHRQSTV